MAPNCHQILRAEVLVIPYRLEQFIVGWIGSVRSSLWPIMEDDDDDVASASMAIFSPLI